VNAPARCRQRRPAAFTWAAGRYLVTVMRSRDGFLLDPVSWLLSHGYKMLAVLDSAGEPLSETQLGRPRTEGPLTDGWGKPLNIEETEIADEKCPYCKFWLSCGHALSCKRPQAEVAFKG
jgi:hypothetical protein